MFESNNLVACEMMILKKIQICYFLKIDRNCVKNCIFSALLKLRCHMPFSVRLLQCVFITTTNKMTENAMQCSKSISKWHVAAVFLEKFESSLKINSCTHVSVQVNTIS